MRTFHLVRTVDASGVSGVGTVAEGVEFSDLTVVIRWRTDFSSTNIYDSITHMLRVHGHEGKTKAVFSDGVEMQ